jgi:hypothetical protein
MPDENGLDVHSRVEEVVARRVAPDQVDDVGSDREQVPGMQLHRTVSDLPSGRAVRL